MEGTKSIIQVLNGGGTNQFSVEKYQRSYSWDKQQWSDLWDDINLLRKNSDRKAKHYMSQVVTYTTSPENNNGRDIIQIVDGQQRLITVSIILSALRNITDEKAVESSNNGDKDKSQYYKDMGCTIFPSLFIIDGSMLPRIHVKKCDQDAFEVILNNKENKFYEIKGKKIKKCYDYFYNKIKSTGDINEIYDNIKKLHISVVECDTQSEANTIFARLNTTGLKMANSDAINCYLFDRLFKESREQSYIDCCVDKILSITNYSESIKDTNFFYYSFLVSQDEYSNGVKDTLSKFKAWLDITCSNIKLKGALEIMENYVEFYKNRYTENTPMRIKTFIKNGLESNSFTIAIIELLYKSNTLRDEDILKILKGAETIEVRRWVKGRTDASKNMLIIHYIKNVKEKIANGEDAGKAVNDTILNISKTNNTWEVGTNEEIRNFLMDKKIFIGTPSKEIARLILTRINNLGNELEIQSFNDIELEHIMPKKGNEYNEHLNNIGNLTLLTKSSNASLKNKGYDKKKELYRQSTIRLNRYFDNIDEWNDSEIIKRSEAICDKFMEIWGIKEN